MVGFRPKRGGKQEILLEEEEGEEARELSAAAGAGDVIS